MTKKPAALKRPHYEAIADKLYALAMGALHRREVTLAAICTAVSTLGVKRDAHIFGLTPEFHNQVLGYLATGDARRMLLTEYWEMICSRYPYLRGHMDRLLSWIDQWHDSDAEAAAACFAYLATLDIEGCVDDCGGELLGPVYTAMMGRGERDAGGKFYTPMTVSRMMARMLMPADPKDMLGTTVSDPCCGAGGMPVAWVLEMAEAGVEPNLVQFVLNDIDPVAVALCGVNLAARNVQNVSLSCADALAPPQVDEQAVWRAS